MYYKVMNNGGQKIIHQKNLQQQDRGNYLYLGISYVKFMEIFYPNILLNHNFMLDQLNQKEQ